MHDRIIGALETCCRQGEMLRIQNRHVDWERHQVAIHTESPANVAGSYLFEPPGTTHTLKIADNAGEWTEILFILYGAMLHMDNDGVIIGVTDAESVLAEYAQRLKEQGSPLPAHLPVGGRMVYRPL